MGFVLRFPGSSERASLFHRRRSPTIVARTQRIAVTTNSDSLPTFMLMSWDQYARTRPPTRPSGKIGTPSIRKHKREMRTATTENPAP